ncbi:MAG: NAD(P)H-dependent oxidoreductase subunit E [Candidatus Omnitrophota bacterium]
MDPEQLKKDVNEIVNTWKGKRGNLIMVLHQIQNRYNYVPREVSLQVSEALNVPLARIYEVITFYHYFKLEPPGKNIISICMGTACYLKGAPQIVEAFEKELEIKVGQSTPDKEFHLQIVRCLGCCGLAPVLTINNKVYGQVSPTRVPEIIASCQQETAAAS